MYCIVFGIWSLVSNCVCLLYKERKVNPAVGRSTIIYPCKERDLYHRQSAENKRSLLLIKYYVLKMYINLS